MSAVFITKMTQFMHMVITPVKVVTAATHLTTNLTVYL